MDDVLGAELRAGVKQVVILGAGYDTRAHRFSPLLKERVVFEVDMPAIQRQKRERLAARGIDTPPWLRYVAVDRDHLDLFVQLEAAGYESKRSSIFIWSGVTMYLQESAFKETLRSIGALSPAGSKIVFDYFSPKSIIGEGDEYGARQVASRVQKLGEPLTFGMEPTQAEGLLIQHGFKVISNLGPKELEQRYLTVDDRSLGRPFGFASIAVGEASS